MESVEGSGEASGQLRSWLGIGVKLTLGVIAILVALILFIQKRPSGLFALKGRAVEA